MSISDEEYWGGETSEDEVWWQVAANDSECSGL